MTIGDINSAEIGSGARYNEGKAPLDLIPLGIIAECSRVAKVLPAPADPLEAALESLGGFQMGGGRDRLVRAACLVSPDWEECARVFDYGRKKYAEWNWLKGMSWSAVIGCAARHLAKMLAGEDLDKESGLPHRGHYLCNIVMLYTYVTHYPEGDDRPKMHLRAGPEIKVPVKLGPIESQGGWAVPQQIKEAQ